MRKNKIDRDEGRDISEKIALGMLKGTGGKLTGESLYDSRLFNQSSGMDAGFGNEDEYNTYSKPLFDRDGNNKNGSTSIYRPKKNDDDIYGDADKQLNDLTNTSRFRADKGFKGTSTATNEKRDGPVQFEKASSSSSSSSSSIHQSKHYDRDNDRRQGRQHDDDDENNNDRYDNRTSSSRVGAGSGGGKQRGRDDDDRDDPFGINDIIDRKKSRRD
jgi:SNW domain-containing protein 1